MGPRARLLAIVAAASLAAAAIVVGVTLATRTTPPGNRAGKPPFLPDGSAGAATTVAVRSALRAWPNGTVARLATLASSRPRSALVHLELGLALFWSHRDADALREWQEAKRVQPDTLSAVEADNLLHPNEPSGLPPFFPSFERPASPAERLLLRGVALQAAHHPVSAERTFGRAAALAPSDPEAQVAAAVGRYDKDRPALAFSRLGPLTLRFPHAQTVRFHLGLLLIYGRAFPASRHQFLLALAEGPKTRLGKAAAIFLARLPGSGTSRPQK